MSRAVDLIFPYLPLLFVYALAFAVSLHDSWYVYTSVKYVNRRGLFTDSLLLVFGRLSWLITAFLALLLVFLILLTQEDGLTSANSGGDVLLWFRVAMFYLIGVTLWIFPRTAYFSARAMLKDQRHDERTDQQVRHDERAKGIDNR